MAAVVVRSGDEGSHCHSHFAGEVEVAEFLIWFPSGFGVGCGSAGPKVTRPREFPLSRPTTVSRRDHGPDTEKKNLKGSRRVDGRKAQAHRARPIPIPIPISAKKWSNRSSSDGRDGEAQDLCGAGADCRRLLPHRRLRYSLPTSAVTLQHESLIHCSVALCVCVLLYCDLTSRMQVAVLFFCHSNLFRLDAFCWLGLCISEMDARQDVP